MAARLLVVDDNANMRELLEMHLRAAGYDVHVAEDGIAAGYAVLRSPPDLIISDVQMPHMDGFEFIAALRADKALPRFPVIFLTTMEEGELRGRDLARRGTTQSRSAWTSFSRWSLPMCPTGGWC